MLFWGSLLWSYLRFDNDFPAECRVPYWHQQGVIPDLVQPALAPGVRGPGQEHGGGGPVKDPKVGGGVG